MPKWAKFVAGLGITLGVFVWYVLENVLSNYLASKVEPLVGAHWAGLVSGLMLAVPVMVAVLLCVVLVFFYGRAHGVGGVQEPAKLPHLRLQFFGDHRIPTEISSTNIINWFAYYSPGLSLDFRDARGNVIQHHESDTSWVIFIVLDRPVGYRQVVPTFSNPAALFGPEVRLQTTRSIVVTTRTQIPAGVLEIEARP